MPAIIPLTFLTIALILLLAGLTSAEPALWLPGVTLAVFALLVIRFVKELR